MGPEWRIVHFKYNSQKKAGSFNLDGVQENVDGEK